jgi:DDE superfamily endonuclease
MVRDRTQYADRRRARRSMRRADIATRRRAEIAAAASVLISMCVVILVLTCAFDHEVRPHARRSRLHVRERVSVEHAFRYFNDIEFTRALRMGRPAFFELVRKLKPGLERDARQGARSSAGRIEPDVRLAVTIRMLAGGSVWDLMQVFGLGRSTTYDIFHATLDVIMFAMQLPGLPCTDSSLLRALADGFKTSRGPVNPIDGCVSALDGIAFCMQRPSKEFTQRVYFCRKGFYALPVQACVDYRYKFQYMSSRAVGSTHDHLAWSISSLALTLETGAMIPGYWIAGDAAYTCTEYLLTTFSKRLLSEEGQQSSRDAYKYFQSSHRVHVEQAFGRLVRRRGILWSPLKFDLPRIGIIVCVAMRLQNYCIDESAHVPRGSPANEIEVNEAFRRWWSNATALREIVSTRQGARSDLQCNTLRDMLTEQLANIGAMRPTGHL